MRVFILLSYSLFVLIANITQSSAQEESRYEQFPYVNEEGEEVFGENYQPEPPEIESLPYWIGRANAGVAVPDPYLGLPQDAFRQEFGIQSLPNEGLAPRRRPNVPLRREFQQGGTLLESFPDTPQGGTTLRSRSRSRAEAEMFVHFVDVGQGDGAIVEFPCGVAVIDVGGEFSSGTGSVDGGKLFVDYLTNFFSERPHLRNTIDVVFLTHPHADHLKGTSRLFDQNGNSKFTIKAVVDNGQSGNSGSLARQKDFRKRAKAKGALYSAVRLAGQVTATGVTNAAIDPINCGNIDPEITAFWGGVDLNDSNFKQFSNPNNHSVIVRIDFGDASFLFTGDLEDKGEALLRSEFADNLGVFDVDVYQVSHHGADDDTSDSWLSVMSPKIAVISMGKPKHHIKHSAWDYGHPRIGTINLMQDEPGIVSGKRTPARNFLAAQKEEIPFKPIRITRSIYGTGWEGTIVMRATTSGKYSIQTSE